jgi:hypothetical protein
LLIFAIFSHGGAIFDASPLLLPAPIYFAGHYQQFRPGMRLEFRALFLIAFAASRFASQLLSSRFTLADSIIY